MENWCLLLYDPDISLQCVCKENLLSGAKPGADLSWQSAVAMPPTGHLSSAGTF